MPALVLNRKVSDLSTTGRDHEQPTPFRSLPVPVAFWMLRMANSPAWLGLAGTGRALGVSPVVSTAAFSRTAAGEGMAPHGRAAGRGPSRPAACGRFLGRGAGGADGA